MKDILYLLTATPDEALADQIAAFSWHGSVGIRNWVLRQAARVDTEPSFRVIAWAADAPEELIGHLYCRRHRTKPDAWFYGDLAVREDCRRQGIARELLTRAIGEIVRQGGTSVSCFVDGRNEASARLQRALGFSACPAVSFDGMEPPRGAGMFVLTLGEKSTNG